MEIVRFAAWILIGILLTVPTCCSAAKKDVCGQGQLDDSYHPEPTSGCARSADKPSYDFKLNRGGARSVHEDEEYHRTKEVSPKLSRASESEETAEHWNDQAQNELKHALEVENLNTNVAKNTIIFLGDGMGIQTITAGRILKGQMNGQSGEEYKLAMDELPHFGLSKTYNVDYQVPDSAGTATAYLTGVKGRYSTLGVNGATEYANCASMKGNEVRSALKDSKIEGKSTGIVTTTYLVHATPAAAYATTPSRNWYDDTRLTAEAVENGCKDIAHQLYDNLPLIDVALGGGRRYFRPNTIKDEYYNSYYRRADGQDFVKMWKHNTEANQERAAYVINKEELDGVDPESVDHLWGMFAPGSMDYEVDRDPMVEPSLAEMTKKAIEILQRNEKGYYLLVEGARIDHGHHDGNAYRALHDMVAFDDAVAMGKSMTSEEDTLIVVTADHSHTFNIGAYGVRGNPIFGLSPSNEDPEVALDLKQFTTLSYGNGPGYQGSTTTDYNNINRENVTAEMAGDKDYLQQTAVPRSSESHGGEDVAILASGPLAHLFGGVHEQNYIAHVMRYATCVGENQDHCQGRESTNEGGETPSPPSQPQLIFLGYDMSEADTEAALYSLFALELVFSLSIVGLCGALIHKKKL